MAEWLGWIIVGVLVAVIAVAACVIFRSTRKWKSPSPTTPEAMDAEARVWSARSMDQR